MRHHVVFRRKREAEQLGQSDDPPVDVPRVRRMQPEPINSLTLNFRQPPRGGAGQVPGFWPDECRCGGPLVVVIGPQAEVIVVGLGIRPHSGNSNYGVHGLLFHQPKTQLTSAVAVEPFEVLAELLPSYLFVHFYRDGQHNAPPVAPAKVHSCEAQCWRSKSAMVRLA
jgi:hypothetical protein